MTTRKRKTAIAPIVRYMLPCEDWGCDEGHSNRITVSGLISNIHATTSAAFPLIYPEMCIFLGVTEGRGRGEGQIVCIDEETGLKVFETPRHLIRFGRDPLEMVAVGFRIRGCPFPFAGVYLLQFWYNGIKLEECPVRVR